ncbi:NAD+ synthase, partial [Chloroflexi bacterium]|nr:NAD+ synthase [Chloroflexota bacterium]
MPTLRLALAQINPSVGDLEQNTNLIIEHIKKAENLGVDVIAFPELAVTGYPPEDLLLRPHFVADNIYASQKIAKSTGQITAIFGFAEPVGKNIYNSAAVANNHEIVDTYQKIHLPNYGVFDEKRYFKEGSEYPVYDLHNVRFGINVCEDIWVSSGPTNVQSANGASLIININGSPFNLGKRKEREEVLIKRAIDNGIYIAYVNMVGGQDELVFDGGSLVVGPTGNILMRADQFKEDMYLYDFKLPKFEKSTDHKSSIKSKNISLSQEKKEFRNITYPTTEIIDQNEEIFKALVLGTQDYVRKCGFSKVLIALSGGVDSSLVAAIAVEALGAENVVGVSLPSRFSS